MHAKRTPAPAALADRLAPTGLCTCSKVRGLARRLTGLYDAALAPHGLTVTQYAALAVLARARQPLAVSDLARYLQMDRTTTSRLVAPLESAGLVGRASARGVGSDRRAHPLGLTPSGRRRLRAAVPAWRAAQEEVVRLLGAPLHGALHRAADAAGRALAGASGTGADR